MDPEDVINLFDSCWFNHEILKKNQSSFKPKQLQSSSSSNITGFSSLRSILVRSKSDDIGSFNSSFSPNSVLFTSRLESIPSTVSDSTSHKQEQDEEQDQATPNTPVVLQLEEKKKKRNKYKRPHPRGGSKSLSELEFEELKGFMDLGFVFSEQDYKDSTLLEILPGLQRLGSEEHHHQHHNNTNTNNSAARRPYLSEAWENNNNMQLKWEIPIVRDEIDMKDNLKLWAHTVASYVR